MDEKSAINRLKQGDIGAIEYLMEVYYTQVVRTAFLIVRDESLAEDIAQAAFIRVFERAKQYDVDRPFKYWFSRIVVNDAILAAKRRERTISLEQLSVNSGDPLDEYLANLEEQNQLTPEALFEKAETQQEIWQVLFQLSVEQRAVIVLRYYLGFSEAQIAEHQDSPLGTIKWRLHSARKRLRSFIGQENS
jgi:RNA polymerase sigma-70 factor (ECF subfamily)